MKTVTRSRRSRFVETLLWVLVALLVGYVGGLRGWWS